MWTSVAKNWKKKQIMLHIHNNDPWILRCVVLHSVFRYQSVGENCGTVYWLLLKQIVSNFLFFMVFLMTFHFPTIFVSGTVKNSFSFWFSHDFLSQRILKTDFFFYYFSMVFGRGSFEERFLCTFFIEFRVGN